MIPSLILAGLIVGRWWIVPVAMVAWPALLIGTGVGSGLSLSAALVAVPNVALGVALRLLAVRLWRFPRDGEPVPICSSGPRQVEALGGLFVRRVPPGPGCRPQETM
jgi:hypothetical protein